MTENIFENKDLNKPCDLLVNRKVHRAYKYVFIDLDDTLWDFHTNAKEVLEQIYQEQKLHLHFSCFEEYFNIYAKKNIELWEMYGKGEISKENLNIQRFKHPMLHVGIDDTDMAIKTCEHFLDLLPTRTTMMPYAMELLDYLYAKYPLTIISNGFTEVQNHKIDSSNIRAYFKHIILSESAKALKPDKRIFEYALLLNNAKPEEVIMIGDSYSSDIEGAINADIDQIFYNSNQQKNSKNFPCTYHVHSLKEVFEIL